MYKNNKICPDEKRMCMWAKDMTLQRYSNISDIVGLIIKTTMILTI